MFIYRFEHIFIDGVLIALAQFCHPLFLKPVLIVGHDERTDVAIILRTFLQQLAVDTVERLAFHVVHRGVLLEYHFVDESIVAFLEHALLSTYADDGVVVEG